MNKIQGFALTYLESVDKDGANDPITPSIIRNIERMAEKYQKFLDSEISQEQATQNEQVEQVKKLKESAPRKKK